jgi:hypothetical protein
MAGQYLMLKWVLKKYDERTGLIWLRTETGGDTL